MTPGFERPPNFESGSEDGEPEELLGITPENCSLEDPSYEVETAWSIKQCEGLLEKCLRRAESKIDDNMGQKEVKKVKITEIEDALQKIEEKYKNADLKKVEGKLASHLLQVFGEKHEQLTGIGPINKRLAGGRPPKPSQGRSRRAVPMGQLTGQHN